MQTTPANSGPILVRPSELAAAPLWGFTEAQAEDLRSQYRRLGQIYKPGKYQIIFRAPKRGEYKQFRAQANEPARRSEAQEMLARKIVVGVFWEGKAHLGEAAAREAIGLVLEDYPAACDSSAASEVIEQLMSGAVADEEKG